MNLTKTLSLKTLLHEQQRYINYFFSTVDAAQLESFFEMLLSCEGNLFFTGIGKSGIIAQKIATTMASTGTSSYHLSTTDALHGDLGNVHKGDLVIMLSKSGESDELLQLVPFLRNKGVRVVAWVSSPDSRLGRAADMFVHLPLERELCPFNLSPTTSAAIQLIFGDVVTVALMRHKGFSQDEYARNHPAGKIGKRISVRVSDLMVRGDALPTCSPDDLLSDVLVELSNKRCGAVLVIDGDRKLLGIFTDGDLRRALQKDQTGILNKPMLELMTSNPRRIEASALAYDAMQAMEADQQHPIAVLPVTEGPTLVGLLKLHDLVQAGF